MWEKKQVRKKYRKKEKETIITKLLDRPLEISLTNSIWLSRSINVPIVKVHMLCYFLINLFDRTHIRCLFNVALSTQCVCCKIECEQRRGHGRNYKSLQKWSR